jgi:hypothetical protein
MKHIKFILIIAALAALFAIPAPAAEVRELSTTGQLNLNASHKITLNWRDLTNAASTLKTNYLYPSLGATNQFPAGTIVAAAWYNVESNFLSSDAALTNITIKVGDSAVTTRVIPTSYIQNSGTGPGNSNTVYNSHMALPYAFTNTARLDSVITSVGGNLSTLTNGQIAIYLKVIRGDLKP